MKNITGLSKRLAFLGYGAFEINYIIQSVASENSIDHAAVFDALEKYVELGTNYLQSYSK